MKKLLISFCLIIASISCTTEPDEFEFTVRFLNDSSEKVKVEGYSPFDELDFYIHH